MADLDDPADNTAHSGKTDALNRPVVAEAGDKANAQKKHSSRSKDVDTTPSAEQSLAAPVGFIRQVELIDRVLAYDPHANEDLLNKAYVFAMKAHGGQTRKSGDPYFTHPLAVAAILTKLKADPATIATALLHDVVEDTETTIAEIEKIFGSEVARLVDGVTKLTQIELRSDASKQAENFRKLVVAMANDVRVLLVKLADRLHNMRTLHHFDDIDKRRRIALETMDIYAPLAGRIGVHRFRDELENLSFREISPDAYETISKRLETFQHAMVRSVVELAQVLRLKLEEVGIKAEIYSREKRPYSIWRKMAAKNVSFDEVADIYAFRVLTENVDDCYKALGVIHKGWRLIPTEFDDYISAPKPNNYQSIHTAVIGPPRDDGTRQRIEIQIRTHEMHDAAERGVAAHWRYKDQGAAKTSGGVEIVVPDHFDLYETPRRLVDMFQHGEDLDEALRYAKLELFQDQVFCFTPKGRVVALPKGATGVDFAYAVHTDVGDSCIGVRINGLAKPLRTALKNGDVIQVLRSESAPPPPEWESIAVTGKARAAIRRRLKRLEHNEQVEIGRALAESVFEGARLEFSIKAVRRGLARLGKDSVDEVMAELGRGDLSVHDLVEAVYPGAAHETESEIRPAALEHFRPRRAISGLPAGVTVEIGKCCTPLPGERVVGIRDDAGEVMVHTIYCKTIARDDPPQERWIDLRWRDDQEEFSSFAQILITVRNGVGVLSEIASLIARYGISIANIAIRSKGEDFVEFITDVEVKNARHLAQLLAGLRASASVVSAERKGAIDDDQ